ncbi:hypothetical protein K3495_g9476 [Podosphaera aphanis]|nr:hypothetical protein K3495_g9476 [Podosphaera aphanis]
MRDQLINKQAIFRPELQTDAIIRDKLYRACRDVQGCNMALFKRSSTFQGASEDIRNSHAIYSRAEIKKTFVASANSSEYSENFNMDRKYKGKSSRYSDQVKTSNKPTTTKKCFICKRFGCWSTNHSDDERNQAYRKFKSEKWDESKVRQYVIEFEGLDPDASKDYEQFINEIEYDMDDYPDSTINNLSKIYVTDLFGDLDGTHVIQELERQSTIHIFQNSYQFAPDESPTMEVSTFLSDRYSSGIFMGIMIDTGAANCSTAGYEKFTALQKSLNVKLDKSKAGETKVQFWIGNISSLGTAEVIIPNGKVFFSKCLCRYAIFIITERFGRFGS